MDDETTRPQPDAAAQLRTRLRGALPKALKARDGAAVSALRSALAAIDNAEAVQVVAAPLTADHPDFAGTVGLGAGEAPRRRLSAAQVADILLAEITDRETAAHDYDRRGRPDQATRLRAEAATLRPHVAAPAPPPEPGRPAGSSRPGAA